MKDIAVATLGGSSAIASILLVFVGFMIMKVEGLPSETADHVIAKYRRAAKWGLLPFLAQSFVILLCYFLDVLPKCTSIQCLDGGVCSRTCIVYWVFRSDNNDALRDQK
jgi:hypothetical protein